MSRSRDQASAFGDSVPLRLPYLTPRLQEFGSLRTLTLAAGNRMMLDGGAIFGMRRTST